MRITYEEGSERVNEKFKIKMPLLFLSLDIHRLSMQIVQKLNYISVV